MAHTARSAPITYGYFIHTGHILLAALFCLNYGQRYFSRCANKKNRNFQSVYLSDTRTVPAIMLCVTGKRVKQERLHDTRIVFVSVNLMVFYFIFGIFLTI